MVSLARYRFTLRLSLFSFSSFSLPTQQVKSDVVFDQNKGPNIGTSDLKKP